MQYKFKSTKKYLCCFSQFSSFDTHLIFQVRRYFKVNAIPREIEQFISFGIELDRIIRNDCGNPLVFIDSLCFLNASLDNLVNFFWKNNYHCVSQEFNANVSNLVKQKRVYLYEYIDSFEKFKESLPSQDKF